MYNNNIYYTGKRYKNNAGAETWFIYFQTYLRVLESKKNRLYRKTRVLLAKGDRVGRIEFVFEYTLNIH